MFRKIKIHPGSKVYVVSTASSTTKQDFQSGMKFLKNLKLEPCFKGHFQNSSSLFAQSDKVCFDYLKKFLFEKDSHLIWSLRGGYGSQRLLPYLDRIKTKPSVRKVFIGYSDTTVLHDWIHDNWSWPTLHFSGLHKIHKLSKVSQVQLKNLLESKTQYQSFPYLKVLNFNKKFKNKKIISRVTGGNLTMIKSLVGTPWQFSRKNRILFLEDVNEQAYEIHRALWQMKQAGVFKGIRALIFGSWEDSIKKDVLTQVLKPLSEQCAFPVLVGLPCGHHSINHPLPLGTKAELTLDHKQGHLKVNTPF